MDAPRSCGQLGARSAAQDRLRACGNAAGKPTHARARAGRNALHRQLEGAHRSAAHSLAEGLEETLTLHHLGLMLELKGCFRTTHCIDSTNSQVGQRTAHVQRWTTAAHRHRWLAAARLDLEPGLRKVKGHQILLLRDRKLQEKLDLRVAQQAA